MCFDAHVLNSIDLWLSNRSAPRSVWVRFVARRVCHVIDDVFFRESRLSMGLCV